MRQTRVLLAVVIVSALTLSALSDTHSAPQKPIQLIYSNFFVSQDIQSRLAETWVKEVETRSNGLVKITYHPDGKLLKGDQIYSGTLKGVTDIGMSAFAYTPGAFPVMEAIDLPLGYPGGRVATGVANDFYERFTPKELSEVKVLYLHAHGPGLLHTKKPVSKIDDLRGMKIRSTGVTAKMVKALGGVPVAMPQEEVYKALQNNVVDATFAPMEVLKAWKQAEVIKFTVDDCCVGYTTGMFVIMNLKKWNNLSSDIKKVFEGVSSQWVPKHGEAWDTADEEARKYTLSLGNKVVSLSLEERGRWANAVRPLIDEYVKDCQKKGLLGKEYVDILSDLIGKHSRK